MTVLLNAVYDFGSADSINGSVSLVLTSTNNGLCGVGKDSLTITVEPNPIANAGDDITICPSTSAQLNGSVMNATGGRWTTNGNGIFIPNDSTLNAMYVPGSVDSALGSITLTLSTLGQQTCSAGSDNLRIIIDIPVIANFTTAIPCQDQATNFIDKSLVLNGTITDWEWNFGDGSSVFEENPDHVYDTTGSFNVTLTVTSSLGCEDSRTKTIFVNPSPIVNFTTTLGCFEDSTLFQDSSTINTGTITRWDWKFFEDDSIGKSGKIVRHLYNDAGNYNVTLAVTSALGCTNSKTKPITILPAVSAGFEFDTTSESRAKEVIIFINTSTGATSYNWNFGDKSPESTNENPPHTYEEEGDYTVTLSISNEIGCTDEVSKDITVLPAEVILPPAVPSGFSPNNDGQNDTLKVRGGPFKLLEFKIYNQWGQLLFETTDTDIGWTGLFKGEIQPVGVYAYTVKAVTKDDESFSMSGSVSLIK